MSFSTGTATDHTDLFNKLRTFLKLASGSGGAGWTENRYDAGQPRMELTAPGLDDAQEINSVISLYSNVGGDTFSLGIRMYPDWQSGFDWDAQTNMSTEVYHPVWNAPMTYWFMGNKQRCIIVTKVSTVFSASYWGRFLPYGSLGEYGLPWYVAAPATTSTTRWSSTSENVRNFFDPTYAYLRDPGGAWRLVRNRYNFDDAETEEYGYINIWPFVGSITLAQSTSDRYKELRENVDGTYPLFPLILHGGNPNYEIYGELDGVYACPGFSAGSEDTVTVSALDHLLVQNMFRTTRYYYAAIAQE